MFVWGVTKKFRFLLQLAFSRDPVRVLHGFTSSILKFYSAVIQVPDRWSC